MHEVEHGHRKEVEFGELSHLFLNKLLQQHEISPTILLPSSMPPTYILRGFVANDTEERRDEQERHHLAEEVAVDSVCKQWV